MRVRADGSKPAAVQADVLAVPIYREDSEIPPDLAELDDACGGAITRTLTWGEFNPLEDETALVEVDGIGAARILFVASGRRGRGAWRARRSAAKATKRLQGRGAESLAYWLRDGEGPDAYASAAIGASPGTFRPYAYYGRVRDTPAMLRSVEELILIGQQAPDEGVLTEAIAIADGVEWARELANRSANDLYPEKMAELARGLVDDGCTV
jgi:leucyl aminopeptidase